MALNRSNSSNSEQLVLRGLTLSVLYTLYLVIRSIGRDIKFTVAFSFILYGYGFLGRGFTDRREILHVGSATSQTGLLPFWGDSPRDGRILVVNRGPYDGIWFYESTIAFSAILV